MGLKCEKRKIYKNDKKKKLSVKGTEVTISPEEDDEYPTLLSKP